MGKLLIAAVAEISLILLVSPQVLAQPFVFTADPDQDETRLRDRFDKVVNYPHEKPGVEVKYVAIETYAATVTAFRNNLGQLAVLSAQGLRTDLERRPTADSRYRQGDRFPRLSVKFCLPNTTIAVNGTKVIKDVS